MKLISNVVMKMSMQSLDLRFTICKCKWGQVVKLPHLKSTSGLFCVDYHDINRESRESILVLPLIHSK